MSRSATVLAQAKINLFLKVLAREASGFHQLETLFCRLALADRLRVRTGVAGRSLDCAGEAMPADGLGPVESNLAWRAAVAFAAAAGWPTGFAIEVEKRIPAGGGLGGGSADAGGVLRALNHLAAKPLPPSRLLEIAGSLGADVPFLTQDASPLALGWGRGDRLLALPPLPRRGCVLLLFPFGVATKDAYGWLDDAPPDEPLALCHSPTELASWPMVESLARNDFEPVVAAKRPPIRNLLRTLREGHGRQLVDFALLCGSGSAIVVFPRSLTADDPVSFGRVEATELRTVMTETAAHVEAVLPDD